MQSGMNVASARASALRPRPVSQATNTPYTAAVAPAEIRSQGNVAIEYELTRPPLRSDVRRVGRSAGDRRRRADDADPRARAAVRRHRLDHEEPRLPRLQHDRHL